MTMTNAEIERNFSYHAPREDQQLRYDTIRYKAKMFTAYINEYCPDSREKSLAITKIEEAVMWANASIARND